MDFWRASQLRHGPSMLHRGCCSVPDIDREARRKSSFPKARAPALRETVIEAEKDGRDIDLFRQFGSLEQTIVEMLEPFTEAFHIRFGNGVSAAVEDISYSLSHRATIAASARAGRGENHRI